MATGDNAYLRSSAVIGADWVGFLCLSLTSIYLFSKLTRFHGPDKDNTFYMGYNESKMLSIFVNLFAAMAYWARICSHANGDVGPAANVVTYKYVDYLLTCPLLTLDLLWSLNLPYKFTYAGFVFCCIICAFMCEAVDGPARYMWFGFGASLFGFTWWSIIGVVRIRLNQFVSKEVKQVRLSLKIACMTYFSIWCGYPSLWLLHEMGILSDVSSALLHTVFDVVAKSLYGLALLSFVIRGEKSNLMFAELTERPGKHDHHHQSHSQDDAWSEEAGEEEWVDGASRRRRRMSQATIVGAKTPRSRAPSIVPDFGEPGAPNPSWLSKSLDARMSVGPRLSGFRPSTNPPHLQVASPSVAPRALPAGLAPPGHYAPPPPAAFEPPSPDTFPSPFVPPLAPPTAGGGRGGGAGAEGAESVQRQIQAVEQELASILAHSRKRHA